MCTVRRDLTLSPVMIGRDVQLRELERHLRAAQAGSGRVVLVGGEAGVGKTRLLREFVERVRVPGEVEILVGRCYREDPTVPYGPFLDAIRRFAREHGWEAIAGAAGAWGGALGKLLPELQDLGTTPGPALDPWGEKQRLFEAVYRVVAPASGHICRVLVLEDLHWSDRTSQELILHLARATEHDRTLVVGTYRSDDLIPGRPLARLITGLTRDRLCHELRLSPLTRSESARMLRIVLDRPIPAAFADTLHERTGGNPFFIEEILRNLVESGHLDALIEDSRQGKRIERIAIPASLRESILDRAGDLDEASLKVLHYAAVVGRRFDFQILLALTGLEEHELLRAVERLVERQLVVEIASQSEDVYIFRHALTREAVYDSLLGRERRTKHRETLHVMEEIYQGRVEAVVDRLAYHSLQARDLERAMRYSRMAGDKAMSVHAYREAVEHYQTALDLTPAEDVRGRADLSGKLGNATYPLGDTDLCARHWEEARRLYERLGDRLRVGGIHRGLGRIAWERGDTRAALEHTLAALEVLEAEPPGYELAQTYNALSQLCMFSSRLRESTAWGEKAIRLAREIGARDIEADALNNIGSSLLEIGEAERGMEHLERSLELGKLSGIPRAAIRAYNNLAFSLLTLGLFERASEVLREGIEYTNRAGWEPSVSLLPGKVGEVEMQLGHWEKAAELMDSAIESGRMGHPISRLKSLPDKAELLRRQGRLDEARRLLEGALPEYERQGEFQAMRELGPVLARVYLALGDTSAAATAIDRCMSMWRDLEAKGRSERLLSTGIEVYLRAGKDAEARELLAALSETADRKVGPLGTALLEAASGLIAHHYGRWQDAAARFERAIVLWQQMGLPYEEAVSRRRRAESLLRAHDPSMRENARQELALARRTFERLGAPLDLEEVEETARRYRLARRAKAPPEAGGSPSGVSLTARELEVLRLVSEGLSNREIAERLILSEHTVHRHVANILAKLDLPSRAAAAAYAAQHYLL